MNALHAVGYLAALIVSAIGLVALGFVASVAWEHWRMRAVNYDDGRPKL